MFANEIARYNGKYTRSECIVNCRIRSARALCDCVPFYLPPLPNIGTTDPPRICTLQHVPCLNKYQSEFFLIYLMCNENIFISMLNFQTFNRQMEYRNITNH